MEDWAALFKLAKLKLNLIAYAIGEEVVGETVFSKVGDSNISHSTFCFFSVAFILLSQRGEVYVLSS